MRKFRPIWGLFGGKQPPEAAVAALSALNIGCCWAADGGADWALQAGFSPEKVIGDGDSLSTHTRNVLQNQLEIDRDQNTTDLDKVIARLPDVLVVAVGFLGGRVDHSLAALSSLARNPARRIILLSDENCVCLIPERLHVNLTKGMTVGIYPLAPARARSKGLKWNVTGLDLSPLGQIATSNEMEGDVLILQDVEGPLILTLPLAALPNLVAGLNTQAD